MRFWDWGIPVKNCLSEIKQNMNFFLHARMKRVLVHSNGTLALAGFQTTQVCFNMHSNSVVLRSHIVNPLVSLYGHAEPSVTSRRN